MVGVLVRVGDVFPNAGQPLIWFPPSDWVRAPDLRLGEAYLTRRRQ